VGAPDKLLICRLFKPISFKPYRPRRGLAKIFEGACPNCAYFTEKFLYTWKARVYQQRISDNSTDVLVPPIGRHPGHLPGWLCLLFVNFNNLGITFVDTGRVKVGTFHTPIATGVEFMLHKL
jgi:hypothetical protein